MKTIIEKSTVSQAYMKPVVMFAFFIGLCLAGISASAYVIRDDFAGHTVGDVLNGTTTPTGGAMWVVKPNTADFVFGTNCLKVLENAEAYVTFASNNAIVRVQGDLNNTNANGWLGLSMGGTSSYPLSNPGIGLLVRANGYFYLQVNAPTVHEFYDTSHFNVGAFNTFAMEYNSYTGTVSVWENGYQMLTNLACASPGPIGLAGFYNNVNDPLLPSFTNFQVDVAVPEPAMLSLLALGVLALGRRRRC